MADKKVTLIRKQNIPFIVNYPDQNGRVRKYVWKGSKGKRLDKKQVPIEVYDWLAMYTTTFQKGSLIIEDSEDEEVKEIKENIEGIEKIEQSILTQEEAEEILTKGNHMVLKKELKELTEGQTEDVARKQKRYIVSVAGEIGIDSSAKRKIICEWAGLDYENSDLIFDKEMKKMYDK